MKFDIKIDQESGRFLPVIMDGDEIVCIAETNYDNRLETVNWIVRNLALINPDGPCSMTRKKVYNDRVVERPGFWEITTYNAKGEQVRSGQYRDIMQEGYLRGLVQEQFRFPLEAAEIIF